MVRSLSVSTSGTKLVDRSLGFRVAVDDHEPDMAELRTEMAERFNQQTVWFGGALAAATALLATIGLLG
jgi:hypothetical protein